MTAIARYGALLTCALLPTLSSGCGEASPAASDGADESAGALDADTIGNDGGNQPDGGATSDQLRRRCQAYCSWMARCSLPQGAGCVDTCVGPSGSPTLYRPEGLEAEAACYMDVGCSEPRATCIERAMAAINPAYASDPSLTACTAKAQLCNTSPATYLEPANCYYTILVTDAIRAKLDTCVQGTCDGLHACFEAAMAIPM